MAKFSWSTSSITEKLERIQRLRNAQFKLMVYSRNVEAKASQKAYFKACYLHGMVDAYIAVVIGESK